MLEKLKVQHNTSSIPSLVSGSQLVLDNGGHKKSIFMLQIWDGDK